MDLYRRLNYLKHGVLKDFLLDSGQQKKPPTFSLESESSPLRGLILNITKKDLWVVVCLAKYI